MGAQNHNLSATGLKQRFNNNGYKLTDQRLAVLETILNNKGRHLSSEEIYELVRQSHPNIGLATVYRTLPILERMRLLNKIYLDDGCIRYESMNPGEQTHHHFLCMGCGAVHEVEEELLGLPVKGILKENKFSVENYIIKLYGYCNKCRERN